MIFVLENYFALIFCWWNLLHAGFSLLKTCIFIFLYVQLIFSLNNLRADFVPETCWCWIFSLWNVYINFLLVKLILFLELVAWWFLFAELVACWFLFMKTCYRLIFLSVKLVHWLFSILKPILFDGACCVLIFVRGTCCVQIFRSWKLVTGSFFSSWNLVHLLILLVKLILFMEFVDVLIFVFW